MEENPYVIRFQRKTRIKFTVTLFLRKIQTHIGLLIQRKVSTTVYVTD